MADYSYQNPLVEEVWTQLHESDSGIVVLSASCAAGKTRMSIRVMKQWVAKYNKKVLVLTHGQTILRSQFKESIEEQEMDSVKLIKHSSDIIDSPEHIHVAIPQTFCRQPQTFFNKYMKQFDLIVVDEAHHYYFAEMVQKILKISKAKQLLLTGSPSKFIAQNQATVSEKKKYNMVFFSTSELMEHKVVTEPNIELLISKYDFRESDYNKNMNLNDSVKLKKSATDKTLDGLLECLSQKLQTECKWSKIKKVMGKTMVTAHSIEHAKDIKDYLDKYKVKCLISTSDNDPDVFNIEKFKKDPDVDLLIVVNRGTLGFNMPELINIVDLSGSLNPDYMFQLMNRVTRRYKQLKKNYIKIMPKEILSLSELHLNFTVALIIPEVFQNYNGNFNRIKSFLKEKEEKSPRKERKEEKEHVSKKTTVSNFKSIPSFELMAKVFENNEEGKLLSGLSSINLKDVLTTWKRKKYSYTDKQEVYDICRKYKIKSKHNYEVARKKYPGVFPASPDKKYPGWSYIEMSGAADFIEEPIWIYANLSKVLKSCEALGITSYEKYVKFHKNDPQLPKNPDLQYLGFTYDLLG